MSGWGIRDRDERSMDGSTPVHAPGCRGKTHPLLGCSPNNSKNNLKKPLNGQNASAERCISGAISTPPESPPPVVWARRLSWPRRRCRWRCPCRRSWGRRAAAGSLVGLNEPSLRRGASWSTSRRALVAVACRTGVAALSTRAYSWLLRMAARFGMLLQRSSIHPARMDGRQPSLQQWRLRRVSCGSNRESCANRQLSESCAACGRARVCACHMLHVKAPFALL